MRGMVKLSARILSIIDSLVLISTSTGSINWIIVSEEILDSFNHNILIFNSKKRLLDLYTL